MAIMHMTSRFRTSAATPSSLWTIPHVGDPRKSSFCPMIRRDPCLARISADHCSEDAFRSVVEVPGSVPELCVDVPVEGAKGQHERPRSGSVGHLLVNSPNYAGSVGRSVRIGHLLVPRVFSTKLHGTGRGEDRMSPLRGQDVRSWTSPSCTTSPSRSPSICDLVR